MNHPQPTVVRKSGYKALLNHPECQLDSASVLSPRLIHSSISSSSNNFRLAAKPLNRQFSSSLFFFRHDWDIWTNACSSQAILSQPAKRQKTSKKTFCEECNRDYHTTSNYGKHRAGPLHDNIRHHCSFGCGRNFLRRDERAKHEKKAHEFLLPQLPLPR